MGSHIELRMLSVLSLALLATLTQANPLLLSNPHIPRLPDGCEDFTVGACSPEKDELIDVYPNIPDEALCQTVCGIQEGCNYFRHSKSTKECKLFHYRFLTSCNVIAGPKEPSIDECAKEEEPSCHPFVRENCKYAGNAVLNKTSITDAHACQDLLITVGFIYKAVYFDFHSDAQDCILYDSKEVDCDAISGPKEPSLDDCNATTPTAGPTPSTPAPGSTPTPSY